MSQAKGVANNIYYIAGDDFSKHTVGDKLVAYGSPGITTAPDDIPIALLQVTAVNPNNLSAQVLLVDPDYQIIPNLRVDDQTDKLRTSNLVPDDNMSAGYLLDQGHIRLRPKSNLAVGTILEVLEPQIIDGVISDYLVGSPPTRMQIVQIGEKNVVAVVEVLMGTWPQPGTLLRVPPQAVSEPNASNCGGQPVLYPSPDTLWTFDNESGVVVYTVNQGAIRNNHIRSLLVDDTGIWLGYSVSPDNTDGVGYFGDMQEREDCLSQDGKSIGRHINDIYRGEAGTLWVATDRDGIWKLENGAWTHYTAENSTLPSDSSYIVTAHQNYTWVGTLGGVDRFNGTSWIVELSKDNNTLVDNAVHAIAFLPNRDIWIGHISNGISVVHPDHTHDIFNVSNGSLTADSVRGIVVDTQGRVWVATAGGGVNVYDSGTWTAYTSSNSLLPSNVVRAIALDKYDRVWAGTDQGTSYFDGQNWIPFIGFSTNDIGFGTSSCQNCPFNNDHVWLATDGAGLIHGTLPSTSQIIQQVMISGIPNLVTPGTTFAPIVTVTLENGVSIEDGDMLHYIEAENHYNSQPLIPPRETGARSDRTYSFSFEDAPLKAPDQPGTYTSTWRLRQAGRYVGQPIVIEFTVGNATASVTAP